MTAPSPDDVRERAAAVCERIAAAGGDPGRVRLVAVTKVFGVEYVALAAAAGLTDVAENYAQELVAKHRAYSAMTAAGGAGGPAQAPRTPPLGTAGGDALEEPTSSVPGGELTWHFVGGVQRNKIARLAPLVGWWHGVDRVEVGRAIASRAPDARMLVEVDMTGIPGRPGIAPGDAETLVGTLRDEGLHVEGLMTVAPPEDRDATRKCFRELARLAASLGLRELSMGMTADFEIAVEEGATMVRIGRALFGPRPGTT